MAVFLSTVGGVAAQFFTNNGVPLSGGKLYTYVAGTTTPAATYTSSSGSTPHANPIVLDSGGRVPGGETWLTDGTSYKFVLKDSADVLIATYDNIVGINSNFVNFFAQEEVQIATAGQTGFTLANSYVPGANTLSVFVDGVNQYNGSTYSYVETSSNTVTFASGLHVGALVKFTTVQSLTSGQQTDAALVSYTPAGAGAVTTTVQAKLRESVSVLDFGADPTGVADSAAAFTAAVATGHAVFVPLGTYKVNSPIATDASPVAKLYIYGERETHNSTSSAMTQINLAGNSSYFVCMGYDSCIKTISFVNGVDVIHHNSQSQDANTTKLIDVCALNWTGTFFKGVERGNGSHLSWVRPVLIAFGAASSVVFDSTNMSYSTDGFDNLTIQDGWIETDSTTAFKIRVGDFSVTDTRLVPYTQANSTWFDFYQPAKAVFINTTFGGESGRKMVNWQADGGSLHFLSCGFYGIAGTSFPGINLLGAPNTIRMDSIASSTNPENIIGVDASMTAASLVALSNTQLTVDGMPEGVVYSLVDTTSLPAMAMAAKYLGAPDTAMVSYSSLLATSSAANQSSGSGSGFSTLTNANAPDPFGANAYGYKFTATGNATGAFGINGGYGVSTLPDGEATYEFLATVTGGSVLVVMTFCGALKTFWIGPGSHRLCFPLRITSTMTRGIGFNFEMATGCTLTLTRFMVFAGYYQQRDFNMYSAAAPTGSYQIERGSRAINSAPTVGQPKAWTCSTSGTPGTWTSEGNL
jgi:hypothetical protein